MWKATLLALCLTLPAVAQQKLSAPQLIDLANAHSPTLREAIAATFDAKDLKEGTAWAGHGSDFFFATRSDSQPSLMIDDAPGPPMQPLAGSDLWYAAAHIEPVGRLHSFHYLVNGAKFGGRLDLPAFGPLSYLQPGVPSGSALAKNRPHQQNLRRHEERILDLCAGAIRPEDSRGAHGLPGWRLVHRSQRQQSCAQRDRQPDRAKERFP